MKTCLATLCHGPYWTNLCKVTGPYMKNYAKKSA